MAETLSPTTLPGQSSSAAITHLNTLLQCGSITQSQYDYYKQKYDSIQQYVLYTYQYETNLLDTAKTMNQTIINYTQYYDNKQLQSSSTTNTINALQYTQSQLNVQLNQCIEQMNILTYESNELKHNKSEYDTNYAAKQHLALESYNDELHNKQMRLAEIHSELQSIDALQVSQSNYTYELNTRIDTYKYTINQSESSRTTKKQQLESQRSEPQRIELSCSMLRNVLVELASESSKLDKQNQSLENEINQQSNKRVYCSQLIDQLHLEQTKWNQRLVEQQSEYDDCMYMIDIENNKLHAILDKQYELQNELSELKYQYNSTQKHCHELTKQIQSDGKRINLYHARFSTVQSTLAPINITIQEYKTQLSELEYELQQQSSTYKKLKCDESVVLKQLQVQIEEVSRSDHKLNERIKYKQELEERIEKLDGVEKSVATNLKQLHHDRQLLSRTGTNLLTQQREYKNQLHVCDRQISDIDIQCQHTIDRYKQLIHRHDKLKVTYNEINQLLQSSQQSIKTVQDKKLLCITEIDSMKYLLKQKTDQLNQLVKQYQSGVQQRNQLRIENNKCAVNNTELQSSLQSSAMELQQMNVLISQVEHKILSIQQQHNILHTHHTTLTQHTVNQNDELTLLYERLCTSEEIYNNGQIQLNKLQDTIKCHTIQYNDLQRQLTYLRGQIPSLESYSQLHARMNELQAEYTLLDSKTEQLCLQLEQPPDNTQLVLHSSAINNTTNNTTLQPRVRLLGGTDPTVQQLTVKLNVLQTRLHNSKENNLESRLILSELHELTDKLALHISETRDETLSISRHVNELQSNIRKLNKQLMTSVSELSVYQAELVKLESDVNTNKLQLIQARERMQRNDAPTDTCDIEYIKLLHDRQRQNEIINQTVRLKNLALNDSTNTIKSSADHRPNAYIPTDGTQLPKPYGANAPFKPTVAPVGQLRHYKTPGVVPVIV